LHGVVRQRGVIHGREDSTRRAKLPAV
jgi:hypothetical protein